VSLGAHFPDGGFAGGAGECRVRAQNAKNKETHIMKTSSAATGIETLARYSHLKPVLLNEKHAFTKDLKSLFKIYHIY